MEIQMKPLLAVLFSLAALLGASAASATSMTLTGAGKAPGAPPAYTGPLDVAGYTSAYAYYGFRCSKSSYTGNVALIRNAATPTTTTQLTCSSGGVINETINSLATTCASSCLVTTLTDQVGSGGDMQGGNS